MVSAKSAGVINCLLIPQLIVILRFLRVNLE